MEIWDYNITRGLSTCLVRFSARGILVQNAFFGFLPRSRTHQKSNRLQQHNLILEQFDFDFPDDEGVEKLEGK